MKYTESPVEVAANPEARLWFERIAAGNANALALMQAFWDWEHVLDDLVDRDKTPTAEQAAEAFLELFHQLSFNPFWRDNSTYLFGLLTSMFNRWVDGDEWAASDDLDKRAVAHVVRCGDLDFYLGVAYLVGGWQHLRSCKGARMYDRADAPAEGG